MVFVLKPLPHKRFTRRGADLVHRVTLPLYQALVGTAVEVATLDNRCAWVVLSVDGCWEAVSDMVASWVCGLYAWAAATCMPCPRGVWWVLPAPA